LRTKRTIYETAKKLFNEKGYYTTTTKEIADMAGYAHGTFFMYFKTKVDVIMEMYEESSARHMEIYHEIDAPSCADKLRIFVSRSLRYVAEEFGIEYLSAIYSNITNLSVELERERNAFMDVNKGIHPAIWKIVELGLQSGEFIDVSADVLHGIILKVIEGHIVQWIATGGKSDLVGEGEQLVEVLLQGIVKKQPSA